MKKIAVIITIHFCMFVFAQEDKKDSKVVIDELNLLTAPASPGANLLGFATTDIEKPTELTDFMVSLQSATSSLTKLPSSYAVDFAPFLLLKKAGDISLDGQSKDKKDKNVFSQTLVISLAIKNTDSTENILNKESVYGGFGFKFSIIRGQYDKKTTDIIKSIELLQKQKLEILKGIVINSELLELEKERAETIKKYGEDSKEVKEIQARVQKKSDELLQVRYKENESKVENVDSAIREKASKLLVSRIGWNWDMAGGISTEFVDKNFSKSRVNNAGLWSTMGYTDEKSGTYLALVRYLYNPDKIYARDNGINDLGDISTLDAGFRYVLGKPQSKLNISLEAIYRSVLGNIDIDSSWRFVFNADYTIIKNQKLTFSFGRNFDGTTTKDGNLIAALTFIKGFGSSRTFSNN